MNTITRRSLAAACALVATAGLAACGGDDGGGDDAAAPVTSTATVPATTAATASGMVGPGCADLAKAAPPDALASMAKQPVSAAASQNPLLNTLVAAVSGKLNKKVNLVDTLDAGEFTVFAPVDDAFTGIDNETLVALKTDAKALTKALNYHVVAGRLAPSDVVGTHATVEGQDLEVTGSGNMLKVNDANVICGGLQTANATVYLIDGVLTPPSS